MIKQAKNEEIVCPMCGASLEVTESSFKCTSCDYQCYLSEVVYKNDNTRKCAACNKALKVDEHMLCDNCLKTATVNYEKMFGGNRK